MTAFLAEGFVALPDRPRAGRPPSVTAAHRDALAAWRDAGERTVPAVAHQRRPPGGDAAKVLARDGLTPQRRPA